MESVLCKVVDRLDMAVALLEYRQDAACQRKLIYANRALSTLTGYEEEELTGVIARLLAGLTCEDQAQEQLFNSCVIDRREIRFTRKDGSMFWAEIELLPLQEHDNACFLLMRDISRRMRALEHEEQASEKLAVTLGSIGDGVMTTDTEGNIDYANYEAERLLEIHSDELKGKRLMDIVRLKQADTHEEVQLPMAQVFRTGEPVGAANDKLLVRRSGEELILNYQLSPILDTQGRISGCVFVFADISKQARLEHELQKNQRMESIALLSGGIAHDFNNILTGILGNISLARNCSDPSDQVASILRSAERAALRARDLTQQLLTFSKGGVPVKTRTSLNSLIRESSSFILSGSNCRCQCKVPKDLWAVEVDEGQINQVINNLLINASQAMKQGGDIEVRAENVEMGARLSIPLEPGFYVKIEVIDNGPGISPEHISRIFDPYFTTKRNGSGLGLATSYSIIKSHDGHILVDSELDVGTTFTFYLPAIPSAVLYAEKAEYKLYNGSGRILLMDDEKMVRRIISDMLSHLGYQVDAAGEGLEAIRMYREAAESDQPYDVLIVDLTVPGGLGGQDVASILLPDYPDARIIVTSGYTNNPVLLNFADYGFCATIQKPYTIQQLSWSLHSVLARNVQA